MAKIVGADDVIPSWNLKPTELKSRIGPGEAGYAVAWDTLTVEQKKFQSTKMAIHAAMIHRMDIAIGRLVQQLKDMGAYENTLIMFVSDNGASAEQIIRGDKHDKSVPPGSAKSYLCLGPGWATVSNAPFRLHKHWNHEGGISSPLIAHWPAGIAARGELRHNPSHFIDIAPTLLDVAGSAWTPTYNQVPVPTHPGTSLVPVFAKDGAIKHNAIWWCHAGNQALRMEDWKITMRKRKGSWELYNLSTDRCEMNNLSALHPEIVKKLSMKWESIAEQFRKDLGKKAKKPKPRNKVIS